MKLYTLTVSGQKFYFWGEIPNHLIEKAEDYCQNLICNIDCPKPEHFFSLVLEYINTNLGCAVTSTHVEHIFRINL